MTEKGNTGGMGISKHRKSGKAPKSPKLRHKMKMEAEKLEKKARKSDLKSQIVGELFNETQN